MLFAASNAFKAIRHRKALSCVVVLSFWVGLFAMYIALAMLDNYFAGLGTVHLKQEQTTGVAELSQASQNVNEDYLSLDDVNAFLDQYGFINGRNIVQDVIKSDVATGKTSTYYAVVSEDFSEFYNYELIDGRFFSAHDCLSHEKICIVEQKLVDTGNTALGGTCEIEGEAYTVVGVIYSTPYRGRVLLPRVRPGDEGDVAKYTLALRYDDLESHSSIRWSELPVNVSHNQTAAQYAVGMISYINTILVGFVSIGIVLMIYGLVNIYNIVVNRILAGSTSYGIRLASGGTKRKVFLQIYIENATLAIVACCLIFVFDPLVDGAVRKVIEHRMGVFTVVALLTIALLVTLVISLLSARRLMKRSIINIIRKLPA